MKEFNELVEVIERLLGPDGCPWDKKQTLATMRDSLLEETYEVIDAINLKDRGHIEEELGDLFFNVVFLCRLAQKEGLFSLNEPLRHIVAKLIRRHPHVFGEAKVDSADHVLKQWEEIKKGEKKERKGLFEGIPKDLPALARAQKVYKKLKKDMPKVEDQKDPEIEYGKELFELVVKGEEKKLEAEQALRKFLSKLETVTTCSKA